MTVTDSFTIDGINDVTYKSGDGTGTSTRSFDSGFLGYLSQYISGGDDLDTTVTLTGSSWTVSALRFGAEGGNHVTITDADDGADRRINYLKLGNSSEVTLISTRVDYINGGEGGDHDITLGSANVKSINLSGDNNTVITGSGYVEYIQTENNSVIDINGDVGSVTTRDDVIFKVNGTADTLEARDGYHDFRLNEGFANFGSTRDSTADIKVKSDFAMDFMKVQNSIADIKIRDGGRIDFLEVSESDTTVEMEGQGRIRKIDTYLGTNDITTGERWIDTITTWESENTIHVGTGGIGYISMGSDSALSHTVTADGYLQFLAVYNDDVVDLTIGDSGGGSVLLGGGDDTVQTGNGTVASMDMGGGNDELTIGTGSVLVVDGGDGDDKFVMTQITGSFFGGGGEGNDTIDFSSFTVGVEFSLDKNGQYQLVDTGYFGESSIENIIGGKKRDDLTGDSGDNYIKGRGGKDKLRGGEGNDTLRGDGGNDIFVFGDNGGTDVIEDFTSGDQIKIKDHVGEFATLVISDSGGDREIIYDGGTILLEDEAGLSLSGSDFIFV